jgi:hypothetical protein
MPKGQKKVALKKKTAKKKTVKPSSSLKKTVKTGKVKLQTEVENAVLTDKEMPVSQTAAETPKAKKTGPTTKATGTAALKGGAVVISTHNDDASAEKSKAVVIRGGKAVLVENIDDVE